MHPFPGLGSAPRSSGIHLLPLGSDSERAVKAPERGYVVVTSAGPHRQVWRSVGDFPSFSPGSDAYPRWVFPAVIRTERLLLRPWAFGDLESVVLYANDELWSRYLPIPHPYTEADARRFIAGQVLLDQQKQFGWALEHEGNAVGGLNLTLLWQGCIAEIGYAIARACWGRGLATEAARGLVDSAFQAQPELARIRASADARNLASTRVLEKIGMTREGLLRSNRYDRGQPVDEVCYGMLREEWAAAGTPGNGG
jgi:[ribosomal protein S5]-alanine N-acetyltransferase